ncbi:MAG: MATE family efflux transporter [Roseburia inulinivorans]
MNVALSEKDRKFREFALEGSMWKVIWKVCYPLAIYQSLNQLFKILDTMMAAHISANAVSTVAYLSQINMAISALGGGLAVGASIKISEAYGEGNFELVKRRVSTLFALCGLLGMAILAILIPVAPQFLRLANTPEEFIEEGTVYFILELVSLVIIFFNNVYIAIERARGNSKRILNLNMMVIGIKLSLTAFFVYVLKGGINYISIATIVSQLALLGVAVFYMNAKENVFGFSWKAISFRKLVVAPMIKLSVPVIVEKWHFHWEKL